ncbi:MAG: cyclic pyranopterin monophosphate synthase MoaC [Metallosphaera yellowstonensis]|jgi:cyclic pyranopterin phosphate synthase|uniref:Probable cyclic pyranopterin monophosphate synthase n=1 Tax=Metallosphaera yellowstonensis MK1 TaxID=671065 RepID=H2C924_9CREN|nr:cyclic pyranopterin monophosphate synthase MoaC [Metallosphaera yellowstonensis]EHP68650.1 molybdenum cofactor biosynthesis protein MoaC [Metallosphaera yellowstonensis MK1]
MSNAVMVDISGKAYSLREAEAEGFIRLRSDTVRLIREGKIEKGDVITVAKTAGILAAKRTPELLPLCHPIPLESVEVKIEVENEGVRVRTRIKAHYKTGVEMEALTATSVALLTVWDMVKKYEKDDKGQYPSTAIEGVRVVEKIKI